MKIEFVGMGYAGSLELLPPRVNLSSGIGGAGSASLDMVIHFDRTTAEKLLRYWEDVPIGVQTTITWDTDEDGS